jgi:hypothetical protein
MYSTPKARKASWISLPDTDDESQGSESDTNSDEVQPIGEIFSHTAKANIQISR